jgi:hypothetical protein
MRTRRLLWPLAGLVLGACGASSVDLEEPPLVETTSPLWGFSTTLWETFQVNACWESDTAPPAEERQWVRDAVARTWSFAGNLEFTGWDICPPTSDGIRIGMIDDATGPRTFLFGTQNRSRQNGLYLNHTFDKWKLTPSTPNFSAVITCTPTSTPQQRRECIENLAVHEFGHVIGFHHEQNWHAAGVPEGTPCWLLVGDEGIGTLYSSAWDLHSVMNYCNPEYGNGRLSAGDFTGMQAAYGVSPRFVAALVGTGII